MKLFFSSKKVGESSRKYPPRVTGLQDVTEVDEQFRVNLFPPVYLFTTLPVFSKKV